MQQAVIGGCVLKIWTVNIRHKKLHISNKSWSVNRTD